MATLKVTDRVGELGNLAGDLGGYLKEQREYARLSLRQLASATGISNPYLSQIERGLRKPSAEVLQQIAKGLQISAEALFLRAGILEESPGLQVEVAIQSDVHLTARQKRVLLDIYTTFRAENLREAMNGAASRVSDGDAAVSGTAFDIAPDAGPEIGTDAGPATRATKASATKAPTLATEAAPAPRKGTKAAKAAKAPRAVKAQKKAQKTATTGVKRAAVRKAVTSRTAKKAAASAQGDEPAATATSTNPSDPNAAPRRTRGARRRTTQGDTNG